MVEKKLKTESRFFLTSRVFRHDQRSFRQNIRRKKCLEYRVKHVCKVSAQSADSFRDRTQKFTFWIWLLFSSALDLGIGALPILQTNFWGLPHSPRQMHVLTGLASRWVDDDKCINVFHAVEYVLSSGRSRISSTAIPATVSYRRYIKKSWRYWKQFCVFLRVGRDIRCFKVWESSIFWLLKSPFSSPPRVMRMYLGISC